MNVLPPDGAVVELDRQRESAWDAFVLAHPEGTFFHRAGWRRVIERSFGHATHYLCVERGGAIVGVLPLAHVRSRLFGDSLVSTAFCVYGGPLASDAAARAALDARAEALARELAVGALVYRSRTPSRLDWARQDQVYATFRKALDADPERNLLAIPRKQRAVVRQAMHRGLEARVEQIPDVQFDLYALSLRNLGTPGFPRRYFRELHRAFAGDCESLVVYHQGQPVSGVLSFYFRDEVLPYYGGGAPVARALGAADFMYWDLIRRAAQRGLRTFDFGRSKVGTGAYAFKKNWGFTPQPLIYEYFLPRGGAIPEHNPLNPKYRFLIKLWKRLPLPVANIVGPRLSRSLG